MDIVHCSLHFHWPGGAGRSTENGDRRSDSAITPMAMVTLLPAFRCDSVTAATGCRSCVLSRLDGNWFLGRKLVEILHFMAARHTVIIHSAMTGGITI